jgi:FMN reductase
VTQRKLVVVSAGLRQPSSTRLLADRLDAAAVAALRDRGVEPASQVIELRDRAQDITNSLLTGFPSAALQATVDEVTGADGLIAVTPIFNASYSGLFKSFFDVLDADALAGKPVLIAATGGTARHSLALEHAVRPLFTYLGCLVVPTSVFAAPEDWGSGGDRERALRERVERAAGELAAVVSERTTAPPADPFEDPTPFADLLSGGAPHS